VVVGVVVIGERVMTPQSGGSGGRRVWRCVRLCRPFLSRRGGRDMAAVPSVKKKHPEKPLPILHLQVRGSGGASFVVPVTGDFRSIHVNQLVIKKSLVQKRRKKKHTSATVHPRILHHPGVGVGMRSWR
jgi:hypothetical protein